MAFIPDPDGSSEPPDVLLTRFPDNTQGLIDADDMRATVQSLGSTDYWLKITNNTQTADIATLTSQVASITGGSDADLTAVWQAIYQISNKVTPPANFTAIPSVTDGGTFFVIAVTGWPASPTDGQQVWLAFPPDTGVVAPTATAKINSSGALSPATPLIEPNGTFLTAAHTPIAKTALLVWDLASVAWVLRQVGT